MAPAAGAAAAVVPPLLPEPLPLPPGVLPLPPLLPLPPELPPPPPLRSPPLSSPPDVVVGVLVVVPVEVFGFVVVVVFVFVVGVAFDAGWVAVDVVLAGARRTPEPTGAGARPIETREIALAARPTATARPSPMTARIAVRSVPGRIMASPWA